LLLQLFAISAILWLDTKQTTSSGGDYVARPSAHVSPDERKKRV
jgi:hypothetical protein